MNTKETIAKLIDKVKITGDYKIPKIIYSMLLFRDSSMD